VGAGGKGEGGGGTTGEAPQAGPLGARRARTGWLGGGGRRTASEEALNGLHERVQGGAGVALTEVGRREAADKTVNAEAARGLVTEAEAGGGVAAHDQPPPPHDLSILVNGEDARPERLAGATGEYAEVVRVLEVLREHDVASVEEGRELGDGEVPYPPGVLVLVGDAGVEDETPPRGGSLVHGEAGAWA
jgi:hypothetical protein